jgi:hypothetical protein
MVKAYGVKNQVFMQSSLSIRLESFLKKVLSKSDWWAEPSPPYETHNWERTMMRPDVVQITNNPHKIMQGGFDSTRHSVMRKGLMDYASLGAHPSSHTWKYFSAFCKLVIRYFVCMEE